MRYKLQIQPQDARLQRHSTVLARPAELHSSALYVLYAIQREVAPHATAQKHGKEPLPASGQSKARPPAARSVLTSASLVLICNQVSASAAQKKRLAADKKMQSNVTKRGLVTDPSVERRQGKLGVGPMMIAVSTTDHRSTSSLCIDSY